MTDTYATDRMTCPTAPTADARRVSWGSIIAGSVIATALMILFTTFGLGIGASVVNPAKEANPLSGLGIGSGIYTIVTQLIAIGAGGFVAARLAGIPRLVTSVLHGASVWAVTTVFLATVAIIGGNAIFGATASLVSSAARGGANAVEAIVPDDLSLPDPSQIAQAVSFEDLPDPLQQTLEEAGVTPQNLQQESQEAFRNVISQSEQQAARQDARQALQDILQSPGNASEDIQALFDDLIGGPNAVLSQEDRTEAQSVLRRNLDITEQDAEELVNQVQSQVEATLNEARQTVEDIQQQAVETAGSAADATATAALLLSLASLLALGAAIGGAFVGKPDNLVGDRNDDHT